MQHKMVITNTTNKYSNNNSNNNSNNISYISFLADFEKYMINKEVYDKYANNTNFKNKQEEQKSKDSQENKNKYDHSKIYIREYDKLFWCFYLISHDREDYYNVDNKHFQIEKQMKIDLVEKIRINKGLLKENKLKINDIEGNLANDKQLEMSGFHAFCLYYNLNVIVCFTNIYYHFQTDDDVGTSIIYMKDNKVYCEKNVSSHKVTEIKDKMFLVENPKKPLKSIGTYKVDELITLCKSFEIIYYDEHHKNFKKNKLYELLSEKMI